MQIELKKEECNYSISILRVLATIAVILIHACTTILENESIIDLLPHLYQHHFRVIEELCRWAVPVFIMMTGYLFLNKSGEITYETIFKKYIFRILGTLLILGIPLAFFARLLDSGFDWSNIHKFIYYAFVDILQGNGPRHLWYLYMLIGAYMIMPILKIFSDKCSLKNQMILILLLYIFNFVFEFIKSEFEINIAFYIPLGYEAFYLLLGKNICYVKKYIESKLQNKSVKYFLYALLLVLFSALFVVKHNNGCINPFVVISAAIIFILIFEIRVKSEKFKKILWTLDRLCFGVYIFHPLWIQLLYKVLKIIPQNCFELFGITIVFTILSFLTAATVRIFHPLKKIL